jgi:SAM-dependent methyltransferase
MSNPSALSAVARSLAQHRTQFEAFTRPATDLILEELGAVREVVDLASGTGDPALALAAALPGARVLATDRFSELLAETERAAHARGLANLQTLQADMHHLPLMAASVDLVTSRLGLQFAGDVRQVLAEILRVLKPGGSTCHVVWGATEQPLLREMLPKGAAFKLGEPGPFQFSHPGTLAKAFQDAGFAAVKEDTRRADWTWHGVAESFSIFMQQTSGGVAEATLDAFERDGTLVFPVEVHVVRAHRV